MKKSQKIALSEVEAPKLAEAPKPIISSLKLWFDEQGNLQFNSDAMTVYTIVGVLRAATLCFDAKLTTNSAAAAPVKVN